MPEIVRPNIRNRGSIFLAVGGLIAWLISFALTVQAFDRLTVGESPGLPIWTFGVVLFVLPIAFGTAMPARTDAARSSPHQRPIVFGVALVIFGVIGWWAAFALSIDKVLVSTEPNRDLDCNFSFLVQCGANLVSWQGSVFGFPNPLLGLAGWTAVVFVGIAVLIGARFAPWFWITFTVGVVGALAFIVWLITQSIFVLGTLCPWCMVTWAVTIPLFWMVVLRSAKGGHFGAAIRRAIGPAYGWVPFITVASYIVIAVLAQLRLDVLLYL